MKKKREWKKWKKTARYLIYPEKTDVQEEEIKKKIINMVRLSLSPPPPPLCFSLFPSLRMMARLGTLSLPRQHPFFPSLLCLPGPRWDLSHRRVMCLRPKNKSLSVSVSVSVSASRLPLAGPCSKKASNQARRKRLCIK